MINFLRELFQNKKKENSQYDLQCQIEELSAQREKARENPIIVKKLEAINGVHIVRNCRGIAQGVTLGGREFSTDEKKEIAFLSTLLNQGDTKW